MVLVMEKSAQRGTRQLGEFQAERSAIGALVNIRTLWVNARYKVNDYPARDGFSVTDNGTTVQYYIVDTDKE